LAKSYGQYIEELNCAYREFYCNGVCKHFDECSKGMESPKIKCDHATRVGKNYGKDGYPKVIVVGKESINKHESFVSPSLLDDASNEHYRKTLFTLALALKGDTPKGFGKHDLEEHKDLLTYFSLTNYYKCAFSDDPDKISGLASNDRMKHNCYKLLLKELEILEGDLVIIQGKFTDKFFWNALNALYPCENKAGKLIWKNQNGKIELYKHTMRERPFYILYSYHPAGKGGWWMKTLDDLKMAILKFREEFNMK